MNAKQTLGLFAMLALTALAAPCLSARADVGAAGHDASQADPAPNSQRSNHPGNPRFRQHATLSVNLDCLKTTEAGEDEVYILVIGRDSHGREWKYRYPSDAPGQEAGHWNMNDRDNDRNAPQHINGIHLAQADIAEGDAVTWDVLVMEEDGGTSATRQALAAQLLEESDNPYALAGAAILEAMNKVGFNIVNDSDDFIGAFSVTVTNQGWKLHTDWHARNRVGGVQAAGADTYLPAPNSQRYYLNGDGSDYHVTCYVR